MTNRGRGSLIYTINKKEYMNTTLPNPTNGHKLNWQKYQANYRHVILESVEDFELEEFGFPDSEQGRIDYIKHRFEHEATLARTRIESITDWIQGLALSLPYTNHDILELAELCGSVKAPLTESEEEKIVSKYWVFMANQINKFIS